MHDYFELGCGDEAECPKCRQLIHCLDEESIRRWTWRPGRPACGVTFCDPQGAPLVGRLCKLERGHKGPHSASKDGAR